MVKSVGPAGQASVSVRAGGATKDVPVTVTAVPSAISLSPSPLALQQKGTAQLTAKLLDLVGGEIAGAPMQFRSSNESVVNVSSTGLVTSVGPSGTATITAISGDLAREVGVSVTPIAKALIVRPDPILLSRNQSLQLLARVLDEVGAEIPNLPATFSSANEGVATVSAGGMVTAVGPLASTTITVRSAGLEVVVPVNARAAGRRRSGQAGSP